MTVEKEVAATTLNLVASPRNQEATIHLPSVVIIGHKAALLEVLTQRHKVQSVEGTLPLNHRFEDMIVALDPSLVTSIMIILEVVSMIADQCS